MRRFLILCLFAAVVVAVLLQLQPGAQFGTGGASAPPAASDATELRIEIRETASQARAHDAAILERWGEDPRAQAWVADCLARESWGVGTAGVMASRESACWRAWSDQASQPEPAG